jgi:glycosyltransferase involved in cell wall biosynthesis
VHIHEESQFINIIKAFNPKVKIVLHMHCEWLTQLDHRMIEQRIKKADLILGCSRYITDKIRQSLPSVAGRCRTLYNGVELAPLTIDPEISKKRLELKQLLFVSRVTPEKGLHVLLDALKEIVEKDPQVHLEVVGYLTTFPVEIGIWLSDDREIQKLESFYTKGSPRPYLDYLERKLVSLNISNNVTFHGLISNEQKLKLFQTAEVFVQPSVWSEPFGMSVIEAMAYQLPVVATKAGGIPEIVEDGETGLLVSPGDSCELAKAILQLLSNVELRRKMGKAGLKRVEYFSWDNVVTNLLRLYSSIFADKIS